MSSTLVKCPHPGCRKPLRLSEELLGRKLRCPHCAQTFVLRAPGSEAESWVAAPSPAGSTTTTAATRRKKIQRRLADYRFVQKLAEGGMGSILICSDESLRRQVAMKVIKPGIAESENQRHRFMQEGRVTGRLEHPNIVPVHELGTDESGTPYFTMKFVRGKSLGQILKDLDAGLPGPSLSELLQIFLKVCDAIAFAHSRRMIHRDLKPDNIMVGDFGEVLVMDWGLARNLDDRSARHAGPDEPDRPRGKDGSEEQPGDEGAPGGSGDEEVARRHAVQETLAAGQTTEGAIAGTPTYMAPEQAEGRTDLLDPRSDIYSLGAILYQIVTLKPPVTGRTIYEVLAKVAAGDIVRPEERAPERTIPKELSAIVQKAMEKIRRRRYPAVGDLSRDIHRFLEGRGVSAKEDTLIESLRKAVKRNRGLSAAVALALVVLIAAAAAFVYDNLIRRSLAEKALLDAQEAEKSRRQVTLERSKDLALQAIRAAEEGRWLESEARASSAEKIAPKGPWADYARGVIARNQKKLDEAQKWLQSALQKDSLHQRSMAALNEIRTSQDRTREATRLLEEPDRVKDWRRLEAAGDVLFQAGEYRLAQTAFQTALKRAREEKFVPPRLVGVLQDKLLETGVWVQCSGFYESFRELKPEEQIKRLKAKFREIHGAEINLTLNFNQGVPSEVDLSSQSAVRYLHPLQSFPISRLNIRDTPVKDLSPLKGLPLQVLECGSLWLYQERSRYPLSDLTPLQGMPLTRLDLSMTSVSELSPLRRLPLKFLSIQATKVTDLTPLAGVPLAEFNCSMTEVRDLTPLKDAPLAVLFCTHSKVSSFEGLQGRPLVELYCGGCSIHNLAALQGTPLVRFDCSGTNVSDLASLRGLPLQELTLSFSKVSDLGQIQGLPLKRLECMQTLVKDLRPLRGLPLARLVIAATKVSDLSPLQGMPLTELDCSQTEVKDLGPLKGCALTSLNIAATLVSDLTPVEGMPLATFDVSSTPVTDLTPLIGLPLRWLNLTGTEVSDLRPLKGLLLDELFLSGTKVTDLTPLEGMLLRVLGLPTGTLTEASREFVERLKRNGCEMR